MPNSNEQSTKRGDVNINLTIRSPDQRNWNAVDYRIPTAGDMILGLDGGVYRVRTSLTDPHSHRIILEEVVPDKPKRKKLVTAKLTRIKPGDRRRVQ